MASRDLKNNINAATSVRPAARTATVTGATVDSNGYESAAVEMIVGTITDGTHTPSLEGSDDNSVWSAVASADLQGSFTALATDTDQEVGYIGAKRYLRVVVTVSGATTGGVYGAQIVRGHPHLPPA